MPERFSLNDWMLGTRSNDDSGRPGYTMQVSFAGSGATSPQVQGNSAAGSADAGNPVKVGGVYSTTLPTLTNGQRGDVQLGSRGSLSVQLMQPDGTNAVSVATTLADATGNAVVALRAQSFGMTFNGASWDRTRKSNAFNRVASSAASGNPAVGKASAGDVMQFWGQNGAAITYLQIYNKATAPVLGTDTPVLTFPIPANATFSQTIPNGGAYFGTGIAYAFTTDAAGATGAAAAAVTAFNLLVA